MRQIFGLRACSHLNALKLFRVPLQNAKNRVHAYERVLKIVVGQIMMHFHDDDQEQIDVVVVQQRTAAHVLDHMVGNIHQRIFIHIGRIPLVTGNQIYVAFNTTV